MRDLETFDPTNREEAEEWLQRFDSQIENEEIKGPFGEFDYFLKYTTSPIRAYAKSIKDGCCDTIKGTPPAGDSLKFNWERFKAKLLEEIFYISGRSSGGTDVVYSPDGDLMEFFYRKVMQLKARNPKISNFEIEQGIRQALPADMRMFIAPAQNEEQLRHNLKLGYENYIASALGSPQSVMVVNRLVDNLESRIKNLAITGKNAGEKVICAETSESREDEKSNKLYPDIEKLKDINLNPSSGTAPPQYQDVMMVGKESEQTSQNRYDNGNYRNNNQFQRNRFNSNRFQNNRFQNDR